MGINNPQPTAASDLPTGAVAQTFERRQTMTGAAGTSGRLVLASVYLRAGQVVSSISFFTTATTSLAGGSNGWGALFDGNRNLLRQSASDASITWTTNSKKTFTLTTPYTVPADGWYYVGYCLVATTMPSVLCLSNYSTATEAPAVGGLSTAGLTDTAPAQAAAVTASTYPYAYVS